MLKDRGRSIRTIGAKVSILQSKQNSNGISPLYLHPASVLSYDQDTGVFTWKVRRGPKKAGARAGNLSAHGYRQIEVLGIRYYEHRLAWFFVTGRWPDGLIDHRNGDPGDNRFENLREADPTQNRANSKLDVRSSSGVKGVHWSREAKKWRAQICVRGVVINLGVHNYKEDAAQAYAEAAERYFGEFARSAC